MLLSKCFHPAETFRVTQIIKRRKLMYRSFARVRPFGLTLTVVVGFAVWLGMTGENSQAQLRRASQKVDVPERFLKRDAITDSIRSNSKELFHVPVRSLNDREYVASVGTIVSDHGGFVIASGDAGINPDRFGEGSIKIDTTIHLPGKSFDPISDPPTETIQGGAAERFGKGYFVVQLGDIATDEVLNSIRGMGLEVLQYVPNNAFFVYGDAQDASRLANHSRVRWLGEFTPEQKISPELTSGYSKDRVKTRMYNIAVFSRADLQSVREEILKASGGKLIAEMELQSSYFNVVRISMDPAQMNAVAAVVDVVRIDSYEFPQIEDERAAHIVSGNYINPTTIAGPGYDPVTQFGVDGTNVTVAVVDDGISIPGNGGFYLTSSNTIDANLRGSTSGAGGGHGHINASIIAGNSPFGGLDPLGYNYSLGIAPKTNILNIPALKANYSGDDATIANDTVTTMGPNGVTGSISNNSWGDGTNVNAYDSLAALYDNLSRDASTAGTVDPLLYVFSAGNNGVSGLTRPKMAKNVIAVGNSENLRADLSSSANNMDDMASSSARGPAADGRIKPDITAPGTVITGSRAGTCGTVTSCFEANHAWSSGTSHAAPQVAGVAALFEQYWKSTHAGTRPSVALTKAAILQTGQEMSGNGSSSPVPNGDEGWGRVNMKYMLNTGASMKYVDQSVDLLSPGENAVYAGRIVDGTKPFRATLVWTDPAGVSDPALVNNLDLAVTIDGTTYRGNNFSGGLTVSGGTADTKNNVEQVWRSGHTLNTNVSISVSAAALNGDGIIGNGDLTDQHFALVVYNFSEEPPTHFNISGRIMSQSGRAIANASVVLTNGPTVVGITRTSSFGFYSFEAVPGSISYTVTALAKRYTFAPQDVNLGTSDLAGIDFISTSGSP
jgi:hypothetical protein